MKTAGSAYGLFIGLDSTRTSTLPSGLYSSKWLSWILHVAATDNLQEFFLFLYAIPSPASIVANNDSIGINRVLA